MIAPECPTSADGLHCLAEATQTAGGDAIVALRSGLFDLCMRGRGWRKMKIKEAEDTGLYY